MTAHKMDGMVYLIFNKVVVDVLVQSILSINLRFITLVISLSFLRFITLVIALSFLIGKYFLVDPFAYFIQG